MIGSCRSLASCGYGFARSDQRAEGRLLDEGYADVAPALAVEVFSPGNTVAELEQKRAAFFAAGTELF